MSFNFAAYLFSRHFAVRLAFLIDCNLYLGVLRNSPTTQITSARALSFPVLVMTLILQVISYA